VSQSEVTRFTRSEVVRHAHSEVKFAQKMILACAACGANFTSAVAETSLLATSLAFKGKLSYLSIKHTHSQWLVWGNISTGITFFTS